MNRPDILRLLKAAITTSIHFVGRVVGVLIALYIEFHTVELLRGYILA